MDTRWTDESLDRMRQLGDPEADRAVKAVFDSGRAHAVQELMDQLVENDQPTPQELPSELKEYIEKTAHLPPFDPTQVAKGEALFREHGPEVMMILACYSLPMDYAAKKGVRVLYRTGYLTNRPNRRLVETAQLVIDVMASGGLGAAGKGIRTAQKVRLMHGAIRHLILNDPKHRWDTASLGMPINQEDLLGTLMSFSWVVIDGLKKLGIRVDDRAAQDYLQVWRVVGTILGIQSASMPLNMVEAGQLTETIRRRQQAESSEGRLMMAALLEMMEANLPIGFKSLPRVLIRRFLPDRVPDWLGVPPVGLMDWMAESVFIEAAAELDRLMSSRPIRHPYRRFSLELLRWIVAVDRGGNRSKFDIPIDLKTFWEAPDGEREPTVLEQLVAWFSRQTA